MTTAHSPVATGLAALTDCLLVQIGPDDWPSTLPHVRAGSGLVITGARATTAATAVRDLTSAPVLVDRARYSGASRALASAPLDANWLARQRDAGVAVPLTDSGYVAAGDGPGLWTLLRNALRLGSDVCCVLPLHRQWLAADAVRLTAAVNAIGLPVALALEHAEDPFGVLSVVRGLEYLLSHAHVPVTLLRSDISALGAIAFGALAGAFGIRSSLRHLYENKPGGAPRRTNAAEAVLWKPGLYMVGTDRLALGHAKNPFDQLWQCHCGICNGRTLDWLHHSAGTDQAHWHTLDLILTERDLLAQLPPGRMRRQSWRAMCRSAEFQFLSVAAQSQRWTVPSAVRHWQKV